MKLTNEAVEAFNKILKKERPKKKMRLTASAGCCGRSFNFNTVDKEDQTDEKVTHQNFTLFVEKKAFELVKEKTIGFQDGQFSFERSEI